MLQEIVILFHVRCTYGINYVFVVAQSGTARDLKTEFTGKIARDTGNASLAILHKESNACFIRN